MRREAHPELPLVQPCSHRAHNADAGGCSGVSVVLGSLGGKGTAERQDILVLPVPHLQIWLGRGVKKMRVEGSRRTGRVHSAFNESCKTSESGMKQIDHEAARKPLPGVEISQH